MRYNSNGENKKAEKLLREVVTTNPNLFEVSYSLGLLLAEMQNFAEAAVYLGKAADGMPQYSRARYNQALALMKLQRWQESENALLQALEADPGNREYFITIANMYLQFNKTVQAEELARKILENSPDHPEAMELIRLLQRK